MARKPAKQPRARLNLDLTRRVHLTLSEATALSDSASITETVRRAIALYHTVLKRQAAGETFFTVDKDGNRKELLLT